MAETTLIFDDTALKSLASKIADRQTRSIHSPAENNSSTFSIKKQNSKINNSKGKTTCFGCGGSHICNVCKFRNAVCRQCGEKNAMFNVFPALIIKFSEQKIRNLPFKQKSKTAHLIESNVIKNNISM